MSHKSKSKSHSSSGWGHEGKPLHASYHPSECYAPARCDNGEEHNPLGFHEEMAQAHAIRRGAR
jgi:hypothetical protein